MNLRLSLRFVLGAMLLTVMASQGHAHRLVVFASTDCHHVLVEARFSNGRKAQIGEVRVLDGKENLLFTGQLSRDGELRIPMTELNVSTGLLIEVDTGDHDDYWIMTPEEINQKCAE